MNKAGYDILRLIHQNPLATQRQLASLSSFSVGKINQVIQKLKEKGYLDSRNQLTAKADSELIRKKPNSAVILAAGFGLRMIPLNIDTPKGLLEVKGEALIERLIKQLHAVGITEIQVVVGYLKESYEYLIDAYDVSLLVNPDYSSKNNLHSLARALPYMANSYIVPCDLWFAENPFSRDEFYSWYSVSDRDDIESIICLNNKGRFRESKPDEAGDAMVGLAYLLQEDLAWFAPRVRELCADPHYDQSFWEQALLENNRWQVWGRKFSAGAVHEFNSINDLRSFNHTKTPFTNPTLALIARVLDVDLKDITDIYPMKTGMTNRSFIFSCGSQRYIMRIPGEGTEKLINRKQEKEVHEALRQVGMADELIYFDPQTGYKLSRELDQARVCDPRDPEDVGRCMKLLREFHQLALQVSHTFDPFEQMEYYETLWRGESSAYRDYPETKAKILNLRDFIRDQVDTWVLCHIDAVPDNFLFYRKPGERSESLRMIDWEYSGMQDPHIDLAMFTIYNNYSQDELDALLDLYFENGYAERDRIKIYAYVAVCGLLWSNWCEYKRLIGIDFGEYSLTQYRYAKVYQRKVVASEFYRNWSRKQLNKKRPETNVSSRSSLG